MVRFALAPAAFALASLAVVASAQEPAADLKAMVGKWALVKSELGGKDVTDQLKTLDFQIRAGGAYTAKVGEMVDEGTFTVDPAKTPREMDIKTGKGGPNAGKTVKAIYTLDGDSLVICYELGGGAERPTAFKTKAGTTQYLAEYRRAK